MLVYWLCHLCILTHLMHAASPHAASNICLSVQVMVCCFHQNNLQKATYEALSVGCNVATLLPFAIQ